MLCEHDGKRQSIVGHAINEVGTTCKVEGPGCKAMGMGEGGHT